MRDLSCAYGPDYDEILRSLFESFSEWFNSSASCTKTVIITRCGLIIHKDRLIRSQLNSRVWRTIKNKFSLLACSRQINFEKELKTSSDQLQFDSNKFGILFRSSFQQIKNSIKLMLMHITTHPQIPIRIEIRNPLHHHKESALNRS